MRIGWPERSSDANAEPTMPIKSKYLFVVSMDVAPGKEALFHEVYDTEHIPHLLKVPGVQSAQRMAGADFAFSVAGKTEKKTHEEPRFTAIYEIDSPDVLASKEWAAAVEKGRWPSEVRPHTSNRKHALLKLR
jgi:hypothetical protein